jgi:hypothetical protein
MQAGRTCSINYNTGTYASPTWTAMGRVSSPKMNEGRPATRRTYRGSPNSKNVLGMLDVGVTFTYVARPGTATDAVLTALLASLRSGTQMDIAMLDRPAGTGAKGMRGPFVVSAMPRNEDDEDAVSYEVTLVEVNHDTEDAFMAAPYTIS